MVDEGISSNDAISIHLGIEIIIQVEPISNKVIHRFNPTYSYYFFGTEEKLHGLQSANITVALTL